MKKQNTKKHLGLQLFWALPVCFIISSAGLTLILFEKVNGGTFSSIIQLVAFIINMFLIWGLIIWIVEELIPPGRYLNSLITILLSNIFAVILSVSFSFLFYLFVKDLIPIDKFLANMNFEGFRDAFIRFGLVMFVSIIGGIGYIIPGYYFAIKYPESVDKSNFPILMSEALKNIENESIEIRKKAINDLGYVGHGSIEVVNVLRKCLAEKEIQWNCIPSLRKLGSEAIIAVPELVSILETTDEMQLKSYLAKTLKDITGIDFGTDALKWGQWIKDKGLI